MARTAMYTAFAGAGRHNIYYRTFPGRGQFPGRWQAKGREKAGNGNWKKLPGADRHGVWFGSPTGRIQAPGPGAGGGRRGIRPGVLREKGGK